MKKIRVLFSLELKINDFMEKWNNFLVKSIKNLSVNVQFLSIAPPHSSFLIVRIWLWVFKNLGMILKIKEKMLFIQKSIYIPQFSQKNLSGFIPNFWGLGSDFQKRGEREKDFQRKYTSLHTKPCIIYLDLSIRCEPKRTLLCNIGLGFTHVLLLEEKLPVQVGHVDGVQINHLDILEP